MSRSSGAMSPSSAFPPSRSTSSSLTTTNHNSYQTMSIARPMAALTTIASDITHIQHQLVRSTSQQSFHHQQLLERLVQLLQEQAEAKERDERVLAELAAAKERDEEMQRMQRRTIDRLIVAQQRIEAILVQNYELHEYPIPRLFVILPDSYEKWDPRNFLAERFRLFFLCECGEHGKTNAMELTSTAQPTFTAAENYAPIAVKNTIHLAKHEGYELSRPTEFFDRYGPYVLGMLRVLKHCLAVATVVAPAVALAENSIKDAMDGVKSIAESTMKAVDMSIDFLEQKLEGDTVTDGVSESDTDAQDEEDRFNKLAALEGLTYDDADKILGNLYRITTNTGHVKWVCLDHYRQVYRKTAMTSFLQCVETYGGVHDPQRGKVTVSLRSSTAAKDFFSRLAQHASAVTTLKVTLDWSFGASDLAMLVNKIAHSNIRDFNVCFRTQSVLMHISLVMRPGSGRYHSVLSLFSNTKIKGLAFFDTHLIGLQTSSLLTSQRPSLLQSFRYESPVDLLADSQLACIISHCPHLIDLRLGTLFSSDGVPAIDRAIGSLSKLLALQRYNLYGWMTSPEVENNVAPYGRTALRELVDVDLAYPAGPAGLLEDAIFRSSATLEVLILGDKRGAIVLDLVDTLSPMLSAAKAFGVPLASLMAHANFYTLKSLYIKSPERDALEAFSDAIFKSSSCEMESLYLDFVPTTPGHLGILSVLSLKRLHIRNIKDKQDGSMKEILQLLNLTEMQVLTIGYAVYSWEAEKVLAGRSTEFTDEFILQLPNDTKNTKGPEV
ncbi:hypothetical protein BGZ89_002796 [Linnemannia elongata]|nr:hypothetical protein BGZ89_002796 [Linnemannia elongata]